jgi:hypothetical protein
MRLFSATSSSRADRATPRSHGGKSAKPPFRRPQILAANTESTAPAASSYAASCNSPLPARALLNRFKSGIFQDILPLRNREISAVSLSFTQRHALPSFPPVNFTCPFVQGKIPQIVPFSCLFSSFSHNVRFVFVV